jgi:hypothetical protein
MKIKERQHLAKVAAIGCIACRKIGFSDTPAEIHHIREGQGMGQRASNYETIPLCPNHHRLMPDAIHQSKANFIERFGSERELLEEVLDETGYQATVSQ